MSPAKLLGLPQTEDSIIVRARGTPNVRMLPERSVQGGADADDGEGAHDVLRDLIIMRRRRNSE